MYSEENVSSKIQKGLALHGIGNLELAKSLYEEVVDLDPNNFEALQLLGTIYAQTANWDEALLFLGRSLKERPNYVAFFNQGLVLEQLGRLEDALRSFDSAIEIKRDYAQAYLNRGVVLKRLKRLDEAVDSFDRAIEHDPSVALAHLHLGESLYKACRLGDSLASLDRALELSPESAEALSMRGVVLHELDRFDEAMECYDRALAADPNSMEAHSNRGALLHDLNRLEEALASYNAAVRLDTRAQNPDLLWNRSLTLLLMGNLERGFREYESRWLCESIKKHSGHRLFKQPLWLGNTPIVQKTILLYGEQGLGDSIMFCRYAKKVKGAGARVLLQVPRQLTSLVIGLDGVDLVIENEGQIPDFDYQCPLMSLPLAFKTDLETVPSSDRYLHTSQDKRDLWRKRLGENSRPLVGLAWSGSSHHKNNKKRSVPLAELLKHLPQGFEYVSLQKDISEADRQALSKRGVRHFEDLLTDFSETAALCENMDLVISVDTSVAHLSGALGKTTWVLLPFTPDWRWMLYRSDSPWYESVKLYRQDSQRNWSGVLKRVSDDLVNHLSR